MPDVKTDKTKNNSLAELLKSSDVNSITSMDMPSCESVGEERNATRIFIKKNSKANAPTNLIS
jgi:hypothetical protein